MVTFNHACKKTIQKTKYPELLINRRFRIYYANKACVNFLKKNNANNPKHKNLLKILLQKQPGFNLKAKIVACFKTGQPILIGDSNFNSEYYRITITPYQNLVRITWLKYIKYGRIQAENLRLKLYLKLLKHMQVGFWSWNVNTGVVFQDEISKSILLTKDFSPKNIKKFFDAAVHPDDSKQYFEFLEKCLLTSEAQTNQFRLLDSNLKAHYIQTAAISLIDSINNQKYVVGLSKDNTNLLSLDKKPSGMFGEFELDKITDGWWDIDFIAKQINLSTKCKKILGLDTNTIKLKYIFKIFSKAELIQLKKAYLMHVKHAKPYHVAVTFKDSNQNSSWALLRGVVVKNSMHQNARMLGTYTDINEDKYKEKYLQSLVNYDPLTKLPNRKYFIQYLTTLINFQSSCANLAVCFFDIDNFKYINDEYSHFTGDLVLKKFALKLKKICRQSDFCA